MEKGFLRNFVKPTGKHLCQSLFLDKVAGLCSHIEPNQLICCPNQLTGFYMRAKACNFIKKENLAQLLSYEFCKISKNIFFTELLRMTAPVIRCKILSFNQKLC